MSEPGRRCRYNQPYSIKPLPQEWLACCSDAGADATLALPAINPFTPQSLDMLPAEEAAESYPKLIVKDEQLTL